MDYNKDEEIAVTPQEKALAIVQNDFRRAKKYLRGWHDECIERYKHYKAASLAVNIEKKNKFPVPFSSEQIDQLTADMMEKLFFKGTPCSIYGREDTDREDADAKRDFMEYQDVADNIFNKIKSAATNCGIYGIAPAVINYKEEYSDEVTLVDEPIEIMPGVPATDMKGEIMTVEKGYRTPTYQGATVEPVDVIDLFWTAEKRLIYDEHPFMIRTFRTLEWFKTKKYIDQEKIPLLKEEQPASRNDDTLNEKRSVIDMGSSRDERIDEYEYVERFGYADLDDSGESRHYIIGMVNEKHIVRLDDAEQIFAMGHPNIVIGNIDEEYGEIRAGSLLDKIHSIQHGMDSLMGMWLKSLRQTVNPMWIVWYDNLKKKQLVNEAGQIIMTKGPIRDTVERVQQEQISKDIYAGLQLFRDMGQNSSGLSDTAEGIAQQGVETLGEAAILESKASLRIKLYLRTFEKTFVEPLYKMRNQVNMRFCTDPGYLYSVLGKKVMFWRWATPDKIRANVDFICEASARENQRGVISQQVLQALNIVVKLVPILGPIPAIKLLEKLYREAFSWKEDEVKEMLPMDIIVANMMQNMMMGGGQPGEGQAPGSMPQGRTEGEVRQSAEAKNRTNVGQVQ